MNTCPESGITRPFTICSNVDLPLPLSPTSAVVTSLGNCTEIPLMTGVPSTQDLYTLANSTQKSLKLTGL